jgi:hypothetical protein
MRIKGRKEAHRAKGIKQRAEEDICSFRKIKSKVQSEKLKLQS